MSKIAIIAAMPGELKPLVKSWKRVPTKNQFIHKWTAGNGWVAVCGGMGADAATRAFAEAEADGPLDIVISMGWAGALRDAKQVGKYYIPNVVVNAQTGERYVLGERESNDVLVTTARVADEAEKRRLAATYSGTMVDMEAATVVRLAQMRGIPVFCMKVITDEVTAKLPDLNPFINAMGQMEIGRFIVHVLWRPRYWSALIRLGKASKHGAGWVGAGIFAFLCKGEADASDIDDINRTGFIPDEWAR